MQSVGNLTEHFRKMQEQKSQKFQNFNSEGLFYKWSDDQIVRFVGDFMTTKIHWINNPTSGYQSQKLKLYPDVVFTEKKLTSTVNCANWDIKKEEYNRDGGCVICKLNKIARSILKDEGDSMSKPERDEMENLKRKTDDKTMHRFNAIVRGAEGMKIVSCGNDLINEISMIQKSYQPKIISSVEDGVDIRITREKTTSKTTYKASIVLLSGATAAITPLTEQEKALKIIDLYDLCGKIPDQELLFQLLEPKWKDIISAYDEMEKSKSSKSGKAPF